MKKLLFIILIIFLAITSNLSLVTAQNESECFSEEEIEENIENETKRIGESVKTPSGGSKNISFEDGYNGYCINKGWNGAESDDTFKVEKTSTAQHNKNHEDVSNYLKILFTYHHDFAISNKDDTANVVWTFSDWNYETSDNPIVKSILSIAESGIVIPDHGFVKQINKTTEALFNFEVLKATHDWHQSFFGYKITYKTIPTENSSNNLIGSVYNESFENKSENEVNTLLNNTQVNNLTNKTNESINSSNNPVNEKSDSTVSKDYETPVSMTKHVTGNNISIAMAILLVLFTVLLSIKSRRD